MWQIKIHRLVLEEDFKKIPPSQQKLIIKRIKKKLTIDPQAYGKPLSGGFSGLWRLRIEDYRVIYRVLKEQVVVLVIKVGIRRDAQVYEELFSRLKKLAS
ncbi:MAG: type II toxin-antitoxin system RelE/ParE family toxin [Candidatus Omnitrophica bacterium]|nr:type II toxin-antitoxin system RelE/ParE family toxin [Candidatus Omnitrophota bacterium]